MVAPEMSVSNEEAVSGSSAYHVRFRAPKGGTYGKRNSLAVIPKYDKGYYRKPVHLIGGFMQTEIEILESRENPSVLWL